MEIDLNVDFGEGCGLDEVLFDFVMLVNIVCGWYVGGVNVMCDCVCWVVQKGVLIGVYLSFYDLENFGCKEMQLLVGDIYVGVLYQFGVLLVIVQVEGGCIVYVKLYGVLYNQVVCDLLIVDVVVLVIYDFDLLFVVFGFVNSVFIVVVWQVGFVVVEEVFVDCGYCVDGLLVLCSLFGVLIDDEDVVFVCMFDMVCNWQVCVLSGEWVLFNVQIVCLYGDGLYVLVFVKWICVVFEVVGVDVVVFGVLQVDEGV